MSKRGAVWAAFFIFGILLVVVGARGRFGSLLASLTTPLSLQDA
jgi:hypothetical protein